MGSEPNKQSDDNQQQGQEESRGKKKPVSTLDQAYLVTRAVLHGTDGGTSMLEGIGKATGAVVKWDSDLLRGV